MQDLYTSIVITFVYILMNIGHSMICNKYDPDLDLSNKLFTREIFIVFFSCYAVLFLMSDNNVMSFKKEPPVQRKW